MAVAIEIGIQINAVMEISQSVPNMADFKPALLGIRDGKLFKKFKFKVPIPLEKISYRIINNTNTLKITADRHKVLNIFVFNFRLNSNPEEAINIFPFCV